MCGHRVLFGVDDALLLVLAMNLVGINDAVA
jgi:hypothetical protein